jgi:hypothetical protein
MQNTEGPFYPTSAVSQSGSDSAWVTPANIYSADGVFTYASFATGGARSNNLYITGFGFNLPSTAVIDGIYFEFLRKGDHAATRTIQVLKAGAVAGTSKPGADGWPITPAYIGYGNTDPFGVLNDLWGTTWTPADINNSGFGFSISASNTSGGGTAYLDTARVSVLWHYAPADVPKRYIYKSYENNGNYLGNLPSVESEFAFNQDINTVGAQISIKLAESIDTSRLPVPSIQTELGADLETESSTPLTIETTPPIASLGNGSSALVKNGNRIIVWEYSYYYPAGRIVFRGQIERWEAELANDMSGINIVAYSDGSDLDNYIVRGAPFTYVADQAQTAVSNYTTMNTNGGKGASFTKFGQSFTVGAGVTNIAAIGVMLQGNADVTLTLSTDSGQSIILGSSTYSGLNVASQAEQLIGFDNPIVVTPGSVLFFSIEVGSGQSMLVYYQNTNVYAGGDMYTNNYGGAGGGGYYANTTQDLYFRTFSGSGSTIGTFTNQDPGSGMLVPIMNDYIARGGLLQASIAGAGYTLTYTFNTNTIYEAIQAVLSLSPSTYYFYVDLGANRLYFLDSLDYPDITLIKGRHVMDNLNFIATIENVKNRVLFSGGATAGVNLYRQYNDATSNTLYGTRLDRKSDNRVTVPGTADAIGLSEIAELKDEKYMTTVGVLAVSMDVAILKPGRIVTLRGWGTFADSLRAQIVRVEYATEIVTLTLGILPTRLNNEFEKVTRDLIAQQTIANPSVPG